MTEQTVLVDQIIDEAALSTSLSSSRAPDAARLEDLLAKARDCQGLTRDEVAELIHVTDPAGVEALFDAAREVKSRVYGERVVLFAPLYVSNECVGNCLYCGYRRDNTDLERRTLTEAEVQAEVRWLIDHGYKRLLLVFGEAQCNDVHAMVRAVEAVYATQSGPGAIRRVNVNAAPLSHEDFLVLQPAQIGTFQVFQETYHRETYGLAHPSGPKSRYDWRVTVWDRCFPAGIDDMGLGVLFGLHDWRWELLALLDHASYLDRAYGVGPHTISVPRLEPALNAPWANLPPAPVSDDEFKRIIALIRLAVPYTGMILSTRETAEMRRECMGLGISQISAGSRTSPGGYTDHHPDDEERQFTVGDDRSLDEVMHDLCLMGYLPSFCTACYRAGRTGEDFMALAKPGTIHQMCLPNALLTFKEYLLDYASAGTRVAGERMIQRHLGDIRKEGLRQATLKRLARLEAGERDLYF
jgi:2-iminoacetate synthase